VALPKVYHQLAVRRGTGWSITGVIAALSPARSSNHRPMSGNQAIIVFALHRAAVGADPRAPELPLADLLYQLKRGRGGGPRRAPSP
jgi:hypothetical protein